MTALETRDDHEVTYREARPRSPDSLRGSRKGWPAWLHGRAVRTQHIFRLDLKTSTWERFHPTDYLPESAPKNAGIYQVISDSQNNLWMAEFTAGHLGKIDAKTTKVTWWPFPTPNARGRRMNIDDQDRIVVTEYRGNKV